MVNIPGIENLNWFALFAQTAYWIAWILLACLVAGAILLLFYYVSFPYKITIWRLYGSGKDGAFSFQKPIKNRARWKDKHKTIWVLMKPYLSRREVQPFDSEYIYPGNRLYAFEFNNIIIPGRININHTEEEIRGEVNPVPYFVRNWQSLTHKKNAQEYAQEGWWENNKAMVYGVITVGICCVLAGATVYLTYKFAAPGVDQMNAMTAAIEGFTDKVSGVGTIPGK